MYTIYYIIFCYNVTLAGSMQFLLRGEKRGRRSTVGNLIEMFWLEQKLSRLFVTGLCGKFGGVRFYRIREFKQYDFNSIPPTSQERAQGRGDEEEVLGLQVAPTLSSADSNSNLVVVVVVVVVVLLLLLLLLLLL